MGRPMDSHAFRPYPTMISGQFSVLNLKLEHCTEQYPILACQGPLVPCSNRFTVQHKLIFRIVPNWLSCPFTSFEYRANQRSVLLRLEVLRFHEQTSNSTMDVFALQGVRVDDERVSSYASWSAVEITLNAIRYRDAPTTELA